MSDQPESAIADVEVLPIQADTSNEPNGEPNETEAKPEAETEEAAKTEADSREDMWPKKAINAISRKSKQLGQLRAEINQERQARADLEEKLKSYTDGPKKGDGAPDPAKFEKYEDYLEAMTDHKLEQRLNERDKKSSEQRKQTEEKARVSEREEYINENASKAIESFPDFQAVMQENSTELGAIAPHVRQAILDADNGAFALYALAKEGLLDELNELPSHKVIAMVTRMEDKAIAMSKNKTVSKAPAPLSPNRGTGQGGKSLDSMSADDLLKWVKSK